MESWLNPEFVLSADKKEAKLHLTALNNKEWYELTLRSSAGDFQKMSESSGNGLPGKLLIPQGEIELTYKSSFKPLKPFTSAEFFK